MGRFRVTIRTTFGEISVEGDSPSDLRNTLISIGVSEEGINSIIEAVKQKLQTPVIPTSVTVIPSKPEVTGIIEYTEDGRPHITYPPEKLTAREAIGLLLYARSPNPISLNELTDLVVSNWKCVDMGYVSATLAQMKAHVIKEGSRGSYLYRLSGAGKSWVENELLPKLKKS